MSTNWVKGNTTHNSSNQNVIIQTSRSCRISYQLHPSERESVCVCYLHVKVGVWGISQRKTSARWLSGIPPGKNLQRTDRMWQQHPLNPTHIHMHTCTHTNTNTKARTPSASGQQPFFKIPIHVFLPESSPASPLLTQRDKTLRDTQIHQKHINCQKIIEIFQGNVKLWTLQICHLPL